MLNASDLVKFEGGPVAAVESKFRPARDSKVTLVRIASHFSEFEAAIAVCNWLKSKDMRWV